MSRISPTAIGLSNIPGLLVTIGLIVVAIVIFTRRSRLGGKVSALAGSGFLLMALGRIFVTLLQVFLPQLYRSTDIYITSLVASNILGTVLNATALGLIIAAIFARSRDPFGGQQP